MLLLPSAPPTANMTAALLSVLLSVLPELLWLFPGYLSSSLYPLSPTFGARLGAWAYMTPSARLPLPMRLANMPLRWLAIPICAVRMQVC